MPLQGEKDHKNCHFWQEIAGKDGYQKHKKQLKNGIRGNAWATLQHGIPGSLDHDSILSSHTFPHGPEMVHMKEIKGKERT